MMAILTEVVEASSSSPSTMYDHKYDVFLSFRGADTRLSFTNHLHTALVNANLTTFLDDEDIQTGDLLKPELENAIKASRASIIVLSENFAYSTWCLDELVLILEQKRNSNQIVMPVFYHVEPTHVRKQQSSFGEAMEKHKLKTEAETNVEERRRLTEKMKIWKNALTQVSGIKGKDAKGRMEADLIEEIVNDIHNKLGVPLGAATLPQLMGVNDHIEAITHWLKDGSSYNVDILTIWGMGGIGKTSLAKYVYELHHHEFTSSFVGDISRRCAGNYHGLLDVQKQLCEDIFKTSPVHVHDVSAYTSMIENAFARKKVLVVLDDVDSLDQVDALLGNKGFHSGSKIIITTKDNSLIERCALFKTEVRPKHTKCILKPLSNDISLELLCLHAFMCNYPIKGYEKVSIEIVRYCQGHPLALKVLGKALHNRDVGEWNDVIGLLKKEPEFHIKNVLQMSFDSLPFKNDKDLFKHIACFFVGTDKGLTETILNACNINTRLGIKNLTDRCLISISSDNKMVMHQLVQEMGRDLVRQESPEKPWKRSRLWCDEESFKVLKRKEGSGNLLGISLDMRMLDKKKLRRSFELKTDALSQMDNLMLLMLNYVQLDGCFKNFPEEIRWLCMQGFHFKSIPSDLPMENLVVLNLSYSNIESFNPQSVVKTQKNSVESCSHDKQLLGSLKILDLSFCFQLLSLGGFFKLPALERLIVSNCISLTEMCESIEQCVELVHIDLSNCHKLKKLPISIGKLKKVETLLLDGCNFHESQIEAIPSDSKFFVISLPRSLRKLSLANNNLCDESFPVDFSCLAMLEDLCLDGNPIVSMPMCVRSLPRLEKLSMRFCHKMISIEHPPRTLKVLAIYSDLSNNRTLPRKIKFDQEMSPLNLHNQYRARRVLILHHPSSLRVFNQFKFEPEMSPLMFNRSWIIFPQSSFEIEGMVKILPMASVEEKVFHSLGWTNLEFTKEMLLELHDTYGKSANSQTQMYYEFGIFSTIYKGKQMPKCIRRICKGSSISFTIPLSHSKLRGLNFCYVETVPPKMPYIKVSNVTSNHTWIYEPYIDFVNGEHCFSCLSHWLFGENEMKCGDQITISVEKGHYSHGQHTKECGTGLVYEDENFKEEEDALDYYKSWNYIIGRDLTPFQLTTGECVLNNDGFLAYASRTNDCYHLFFDYGACYKEEGRVTFKEAFKAFSKKEPRILGSEDKKRQLETVYDKMWKQSHYKNESMPLDIVLECSGSVVESVDLEENIQEHNFDWVDKRPSKTWEAYEEYLLEKYGDDANEHPQFDHEFWPRASNEGNKGLHNLSNVSGLLALITSTPSAAYSKTQYEPTRQDLEIQKLNGVIEELTKEKEAMHNKMTSMEALLKLMFQNNQPPS